MLNLAFRFAVRELRGGLRGFAVLLGCLALGVAAIAAIGTLSNAITDAMIREGRVILGGDLALSLTHREILPDEQAGLARFGRVSAVATTRGMARPASDVAPALVEIKAVDGAYPLAGQLVSEPPMERGLLARREGVYGALAEEGLMVRLSLKTGERLKVGDETFEIRGVLKSEPDKFGSGLGFGPRLLVSLEALRGSSLIQPGSLVRWHYRLALDNPSDEHLKSTKTAIEAAHPQAGWDIRTRISASPQMSQNVERLTEFLTLVGITALLVGGVGVANAVRAHLEARRESIAILKALGASGNLVLLVYVIEVMLIAAIGIVAGLLVGVALPFLAVALAGPLLPLKLIISISPATLALAAAYGVLIALSFALWPLALARKLPVQALFRDTADEGRGWPQLRYAALAALPMLALVALVLAMSSDLRIAGLYLLAAGGSFVVLRFVSLLIMALARRLPRPRSTPLRLAIVNIARPQALTPTIVLSLGLGLTLLVTLALIDANLRRQLSTGMEGNAPSFYFIDVPAMSLAGFTADLAQKAPQAKLVSVPMLRGRITALKGRPVDEVAAPSSVQWVLRGDRGITYADTLPDNARLVEGAWWAADYAGPPLVSLEEKIAAALELKLGDEISVSVLGRNITARIINTRAVKWESLGINFVMVFSPNTFRGAPHTHLVTMTYAAPVPVRTELDLLRALSGQYPNIAAIRVKEALETINGLLGKFAVAVRGASSITILSSILVLAGALAAGHRARIREAAILKTLGATRGQLMLSYLGEYLLLGLATALFAVLAGAAAAYMVVTKVMGMGFVLLPEPVLLTVSLALFLTLVLGLAGTWSTLSLRPASILRDN
jgi:putative ABC transport system permease protein